MNRLAMAAMVVMVLSGAEMALAERAPSSMAETCPAYAARLLDARASLGRGDRVGAVAALRGAQDALAACIRRTGGGVALASRSSLAPRG